MKLLGALVCVAAALVCACVHASPLVNDALDASPLDASPQAAGCTFNPNCDATGEEKIPIPCEGFCDKYFFCQNGQPQLKDCGRNFIGMKEYFNNYNRKCEVGFKDCDWWRDDKDTTTTANPSSSTTTGIPDPSQSTSPGDSDPTASTASTEPTTPTTTEGPCHWDANCDATGIELKPIPCAGFCNSYYKCVEGQPTLETCPTFMNFNNNTRECSISFRDCNWYKAFQTTSTASAAETTKPTGATGSTQQTTTSKPKSTTSKPNRASSLVYSTTSLLAAVLMPLLARYI